MPWEMKEGKNAHKKVNEGNKIMQEKKVVMWG